MDCAIRGLPANSPECIALIAGYGVVGGAMLAPAGPVALAGLGLGAGSGAAQCAAQGLPAGSQACLNLIASGAGSGGYLGGIGGPMGVLVGMGINQQDQNPFLSLLSELGIGLKSPLAPIVAEVFKSVGQTTCHIGEAKMIAENPEACKRAGGFALN